MHSKFKFESVRAFHERQYFNICGNILEKYAKFIDKPSKQVCFKSIMIIDMTIPQKNTLQFIYNIILFNTTLINTTLFSTTLFNTTLTSVRVWKKPVLS